MIRSQNYHTRDALPINPYSSHEILDYINLFIVVLSITQDMRCSLCRNLFLDCSRLLCGHSFCEYCLLKHLRTISICPVCHKTVSVHLSRRTYQIDSFLDFVHPKLQKILKLKTHRQYSSEHLLSRSQRTLTNSAQASSPELRETVRAIRRDRLKQIKFNSQALPSQSFFDRVADISYSINQSIPGCFLAIFTSVFCSFSIIYTCDLLQEFGLGWIRQISFALLTTCIIFGTYAHVHHLDEKPFWRRFIQTKSKNIARPLPLEDDLITCQMKNGTFTTEEIREDTLEILNAILD